METEFEIQAVMMDNRRPRRGGVLTKWVVFDDPGDEKHYKVTSSGTLGVLLTYKGKDRRIPYRNIILDINEENYVKCLTARCPLISEAATWWAQANGKVEL